MFFIACSMFFDGSPCLRYLLSMCYVLAHQLILQVMMTIMNLVMLKRRHERDRPFDVLDILFVNWIQLVGV